VAREFEVKLEIPASTVSKVMRLPWLWELATGELRASRIASTYYDTPKYALRERGITLRVRRIGSAHLQTIKARVNGGALPIERDEWEEEIVGDEPELKLGAGTPLEGMSRKKLRKQLQPCFEVQVDRSAFPIQSANSAIEIAIDRASIVGPTPASFCEIELELKRGASSELARIARRIASEVPAALALSTKADRGFALQKEERPTPYFAEPLALDPSMRVAEAFQAIGWSCMRHFVLNRDAVEAGDVRAVAQMRAGIERLRAAMTAYARLLDGPETDAVADGLNWLADELRPARELDVFLHETLSAMGSTHIDPTALDLLRTDVQARLERAVAQARSAVTSDRCRQLFLRTALWLVAAEWSDSGVDVRDEPNRRVAGFAQRALEEQARNIFRTMRRFAHLAGAERDDLRRSLTELQHATHFFEPLSPSKRATEKRFDAALARLLAHMGRLHDIAVNERLHDEFMRTWTSEATPDPQAAQKAFAMGFALGRLQQEKEERGAAVRKLSRSLARRAAAKS
jgi:triphosphatase